MKRKKKRYYNYRPRVKRDRTPILSLLTPVIIFWILRWLLIFIIGLIIVALIYWTHLINLHKNRYHTKIRASILSYAIAWWIIAWWLCYWYHKIDAISNKIDEMTEWFSKVISIWQGKKWNLELQPNELWIMQDVLNNMTKTTWQVQ